MTATTAVQICVCGRGCSKIAATAVATVLPSKLGLDLASATAMAVVRRQQQCRGKLGIPELAAVASETRHQCQDNNDGSGSNLACQKCQGGDKVTARWQ